MKDQADADRVVQILRKRGQEITAQRKTEVTAKAPLTNLEFEFDGPKFCRSAAKTALTGACVIYGNAAVLRNADPQLRTAVRHGSPDIRDFSCWNLSNPWPDRLAIRPHASTPTARESGFEHELMIADIAGHWVGYVNYFGVFRFSVRLGDAAGLPARGLAVNPRSLQRERFELTFGPPAAYVPTTLAAFTQNSAKIRQALSESLSAILTKWHAESTERYSQELVASLFEAVVSASTEAEREACIEKWTRKVTELEFGSGWFEVPVENGASD